MVGSFTSIDLIGAIHGHAEALEALLKKLGYKLHGGSYKHDEGRTVVFLGDYIDRGPRIPCPRCSHSNGMWPKGEFVLCVGGRE